MEGTEVGTGRGRVVVDEGVGGILADDVKEGKVTVGVAIDPAVDV